MKICIITGLYSPHSKGGAEAVAEGAAMEFKKAGHEVFVITARPFAGLSSLMPELAEENGIKIYRFFPLNIFFYGNISRHNFLLRVLWHFIDIWNTHAFLGISKILKTIRPDVVLTHNIKGFGLILPSTLISARRENNLSYKWIHTLHDAQLVAPSGILRLGEENKLSHKIYSVLTRALFCSPDVVVSPSKWLLDFYSERGFFPKSEKRVIPNPANSQQPTANSSKSDDCHFLYLGQMEEHKGILFLIDAFKKFISAKSYPAPEQVRYGAGKLKAISCTLTIAGGGSLLEEVKRQATGTPEIKVFGPVSREAIGDLFSSHSATIVPSLVYENAPSVISESLSYGVPVLASRIGGIPEMVEDGINGLLFEPGNTESLISVMEKAVTSPLPAITPKPQPNYVAEILSLIS